MSATGSWLLIKGRTCLENVDRNEPRLVGAPLGFREGRQACQRWLRMGGARSCPGREAETANSNFQQFSPDHMMMRNPSFPHVLTSSENRNKQGMKKEAETCHGGKRRRGPGEQILGQEPPAPGWRRLDRRRPMWLQWVLLLLCAPGSLSLQGPSKVMGTVGGSLSVSCQYQEEYKRFAKYWCRQPCLPFFSETVETSASGGEVRSGRVSITDHPRNLTFTVTLENLTASDAGKYSLQQRHLFKDTWTSQPRPRVPAQQRPLPAPRVPEGSPVSEHAQCRPLGEQASAGNLWPNAVRLRRPTAVLARRCPVQRHSHSHERRRNL